MLPGLNMAGFLYSGADIGGFGDNTTEDLLLRWLALGCFTPLMRNHCAWNGRNQEPYVFGKKEAFKSLLDLRYALIPYLYSEFVKAAVTGNCYLRPLAFDFSNDRKACACEDQLLLGEGIMIAPVYTQNAIGRYVYLPEDMTQVTWAKGDASYKELKAGDYFVDIPLDTVVFFVRKEKAVPLSIQGKLALVGSGASYSLYDDNGYTRNIDLNSLQKITK